MVYVEAFSKVLPVLLLFGLGAFFRRTGFVQPSTIQDIKKIIVNVTLPAVLFLAFAAVSLEAGHLVVAAQAEHAGQHDVLRRATVPAHLAVGSLK